MCNGKNRSFALALIAVYATSQRIYQSVCESRGRKIRATIALSFGMIFFGAGALAQQCNFKCTCANPSEGFVACPSLTQQQCEQAAARASVGGAVCTGAMSATCQTEKHVAPPPGSYAQTCRDCQNDCTFLLCNCRSPDGTIKQTGIDYAACPGHAIANESGKLICSR